MKFEFNHLEKSVLDSLSKKGRVYLVGGIVRDMVMYQKVDYHDVDVEIYDLEIDEIIDILSQYGKVNEVGKSFGILKLDCLPNFDFALPRIERKKGQTHREFEVEVHKDLDMKTACCRRDFTINAMMYDYQNGKLIDYYQGREDIKNKCLKMVDEKTFYEDPLRVLRLAQFMSRFEFQVDLKTKEICQKMVNEGVLQYLSLERIQQEYNKLLMSSHPSTGLKFLLELNALIRPLETLVTCPQRLDFHPEGNVMNHTLLVVDLAALCKDKTSWPLAFMWSALLHDIGKPLVTTPEGKAPGHNESGVKVFNQYFNHFFTNKKMKKYIAFILSCALLVLQCSFVFAEEPEQYEMLEMEDDSVFSMESQSEVAPCLLYIANVGTSIVKISSNQVGIRAETVCSEKVKSIDVTYSLQKWNGSNWVTIASKSAVAYDVAQTSKSYTITGVSSGRYRTKATAFVTGYTGYSERLTGYSGSITI